MKNSRIIFSAIPLLLILASFALISVQFGTGSTASVGPIWTNTGATVLVDESTRNNYETAFPYIRFKPSVTGDVRARVNVANPRDDGMNPGWNRLEVTYTDQDGSGNSYYVLIKIYSVSKATGAYIGPIWTFNSNSYAAAVNGVQHHSLTFALSFDFRANAYWLMVTLHRSVTTKNPTLYALSMDIYP